ncbi:MAG: PEGA domain-containing protein [Deltaproteobacteria bacterium]|nr:PEGA domain-containing protein [Deltaproteobacteria bacterium]
MRPVISAIIAVALLGATPVQASGLAIFRVDPLGVDSQTVARLEGLLRIELGRLVDAAMPSALRVQRLMQRNRDLQACTGDVSCLAKAGRLLGVDRIISGNVGGLGDSYVVNLKLVDVSREKEVRRVQESISGDPNQLIEAVRVAAYGLVAPERLRGSLIVLANVAGAAVYLDGKLVGRTPLPLQRNLPAKESQLRVSKGGFTDALQKVQIRFQKMAQVVVTLTVPEGAERPSSIPHELRRPMPWYTRWWFWATVGVVAAGAGSALGLALGKSSGTNCNAEPAACGL